VLAATNRPQAIDAALMRPGRFDSVSTSVSERGLIKSVHLKILLYCRE
jgi:ATP-dependent 26S proteasome regulatory subunit